MLGGELANRDSNHTEKADDNVTDAGILPAGRYAVRRDVGQGDLRSFRPFQRMLPNPRFPSPALETAKSACFARESPT
jgi:hypothetical protein